MFVFLSLILKYQTLTEAVEDSLTGQLEDTFAVDPRTNATLLLASTLSALVVGGGPSRISNVCLRLVERVRAGRRESGVGRAPRIVRIVGHVGVGLG